MVPRRPKCKEGRYSEPHADLHISMKHTNTDKHKKMRYLFILLQARSTMFTCQCYFISAGKLCTQSLDAQNPLFSFLPRSCLWEAKTWMQNQPLLDPFCFRKLCAGLAVLINPLIDWMSSPALLILKPLVQGLLRTPCISLPLLCKTFLLGEALTRASTHIHLSTCRTQRQHYRWPSIV